MQNKDPAKKDFFLKYELVLVISLLLLAFILRIYSLSEGSMSFDEFHCLRAAENLSKEYLSIIFHPPLYFIFLNLWMGVFGKEQFILRLPSVIFSIFSLVYFYLFSKELFNRKVAITALAIATFSNFLIFHSQEVKMYSLFFWFILASFYHLHKMVSKKEKTLWYGLYITLAIYTHYLGFFVLFSQILYFFISSGFKKTAKEFYLILLAIIPVALELIYNVIFTRWALVWINKFNIFTLLKTLNIFSGSNILVGEKSISLLIILSFFLILYGFFNSNKRGKSFDYNPNKGFLLFFFLIPMIITIIISIFVNPFYAENTVRYVGYCIFFWILLVSIGVTKLNPKPFFVISILLLLSLPLYSRFSDETAYKDDWKGVIEVFSDKNVTIVAYGDMERYILTYYKPELAQNIRLYDSNEKISEAYIVLFEEYYNSNKSNFGNVKEIITKGSVLILII